MAAPKPPTLEDLLKVLNEEIAQPNPKFVELLRVLFSGGQESDAAFSYLMAQANEFFNELIIVFQPVSEEMSQRDHNSYNWYYHALLDLISSASSPKVLSILYRELSNAHPEARNIAIGILMRKGNRNKEARKILWNARTLEFSTSEETHQFREAIRKALRGDNE